jgi:polyphosphate kinase 2 (PPK2 family)
VNYLHQLKVLLGAGVKLKDIDPAFKEGYKNREAADEEIAQFQKRLRELQMLLYAQRRQSLLICLPAMDTGGKDGTGTHGVKGLDRVTLGPLAWLMVRKP